MEASFAACWVFGRVAAKDPAAFVICIYKEFIGLNLKPQALKT